MVNLDAQHLGASGAYLLRWRMRRRRSFKRFMRFLCHFGRMPRGRLTVPISCVTRARDESANGGSQKKKKGGEECDGDVIDEREDGQRQRREEEGKGEGGEVSKEERGRDCITGPPQPQSPSQGCGKNAKANRSTVVLPLKRKTVTRVRCGCCQRYDFKRKRRSHPSRERPYRVTM
jgi:hypothetical protein